MSRFLRHCLISAVSFGLSSCADKPENDPLADPPPESEYRGAETGDFEIPTVTPLQNGNIVVRFKKTGCSVLFDHDGKLLEGDNLCDDVELYRARKAVKAHIAEREADFLNV